MRATSTLTRMGAAAQEQLRGASAVDSRTDEPRRRALHGQHSRANARETEQMSGDSPSGGAHFSMCTFDRAGCKDGSVLAAGGAAIRGSSGRSSEYYDRVPDRNSLVTNSSGRTFVMYHGTTWRNWQRIKQHGFLLSNSASGLGEGVYLTRSERKAEFYSKSKWGVIVKVRVELGKMITISRQGRRRGEGNTRRNKRKSPSARRASADRHRKWNKVSRGSVREAGGSTAGEHREQLQGST